MARDRGNRGPVSAADGGSTPGWRHYHVSIKDSRLSPLGSWRVRRKITDGSPSFRLRALAVEGFRALPDIGCDRESISRRPSGIQGCPRAAEAEASPRPTPLSAASPTRGGALGKHRTTEATVASGPSP